MGIGIATLVVSGLSERLALRHPGPEGSMTEAVLTLLPFALLMAALGWTARAPKR